MHSAEAGLKQKAATGILWSVIQKWGREGISLLTFVFLSRLVAPEAFGLLAMASVFTTFAQVFLDQGFGAAVVQRADLEKEHLDTAFWISILTSVVLTGGSIALSGLVASLYKEPQLAPILRWLSLSFLLSGLSSTQSAILQRRLAFKSLAARSLAATVVGGVVGVGMALAGFGVWSLIAQQLANGLTSAVVLWRASEWRPGFHISRQHYKELFTFGVSIVGNSGLAVLVRRSDDLLIGYFLGATALGYYTVGYRILLIMIQLVTGITNTVAFPTFSRLQEKPARLRSVFYKVTQYTSLLAFPVFTGLAVVAPELVPVVFGAAWLPSVPVMQILSLIGILQSVFVFNGSVIKASGKPSWQFGIAVVTTIGSVGGFLLAVRWGIVAVAASFVITGYLLAPISYLAVHKLLHINFKTYLTQFTAPMAASIAMIGVIMAVKQLLGGQEMNMYVRLFAYVSTGALTYLLVIWLTARTLTGQVLELANLVLPKWKYKGDLP